jgi:hypothetical protein
MLINDIIFCSRLTSYRFCVLDGGKQFDTLRVHERGYFLNRRQNVMVFNTMNVRTGTLYMRNKGDTSLMIDIFFIQFEKHHRLHANFL